jgi:hypothetical protein
MKWGVFAYNYAWSHFVFLFDGWVAKCAMAVPIVGYLILFNDSVSQHLAFNELAAETSISSGLSPSARLKLVYFGLILLGAANIAYRVKRPFVLRLGTDSFQYVENALRNFTVSSYVHIHETVRHEGHHTLHGKYYDSEYDAFLNTALGEMRAGERDEATANWSMAKSKHEGLLRSMLIENFARNDVKKRFWLTGCILLSSLGYSLLLIRVPIYLSKC